MKIFFTFYETVKNAYTNEVLIREQMQLRFRTQEEMNESLHHVGFSQIQVYGDWEFKRATAESKSLIFHCVK